MRQFVSWRWWLTILVLVGLAVVLVGAVGWPGGDEIDDLVEPVQRRLDLIGVPETSSVPDEWTIRDGATVGEASFTIDGRVHRIASGTLGEIRCDALVQRCVLLADQLGDAVVWFTLLPVDPATDEVELPAIQVPLDGVTWARLTNGWELPLLTVVERRCDEETTSFLDFLDRFGEDNVSYLDVTQREISAVRCITS